MLLFDVYNVFVTPFAFAETPPPSGNGGGLVHGGGIFGLVCGGTF